MDRELAKYLLPDSLLNYFELVSHSSDGKSINFYLEEKNILPDEYVGEPAHSKGFSSTIIIEDFPLRGQPVKLHIRKRRWTLLNSNTVVTRNWDIAAKGTRMTKELASFLKE